MIWLHDVVHVVKADNGRPIGLRGIMVDITKRRESEEALRRSEEARKRAEQIALLMKVEISLDGRWKQFPPMLCSFLGYSEGELYSSPCSLVTHPADRAGV